MSFKGVTNKGRYQKDKMTRDHANCLGLKIQLRNKFLSKIKQPFSLIEPFYGYGEMSERIYNNYKLSKHEKLDIEPIDKSIKKADANVYPIGKKLNYNVIDLDHHKLEVLQTFSHWCKSMQGDCTFFITFGIMSFARKTFVKEQTVKYKGGEKKMQLNYQLSYTMPEQYIKDCAKDNGFKVCNLIKIRYKNIVSYYAFELKKNDSR
jgi:hypothetical protein